MRFTKMHGLGNDYIYINCLEENIEDSSKAAKILSNRHFGVGSDGLVLIMPSKKADFRMRMYNPDGSEAEMCGNAIRCVGKYVYDRGMTKNTVIRIETLAGIKTLDMTVKNKRVELVRVDMGEPVLNPKEIPVISEKDIFMSEPIKLKGKTYNATCVSMGNPHAVIYVDDVSSFPVESVGHEIEIHRLFPKKINVEFVEVIDNDILKMRVWERGTGETLACGTGACAALVASVMNRVSSRNVELRLLGGNLNIEWSEKDNHVYMTGPAVEVFTGELS